MDQMSPALVTSVDAGQIQPDLFAVLGGEADENLDELPTVNGGEAGVHLVVSDSNRKLFGFL
ncbi:hypothetical protein TIFTF001_003070 [Ficus carica]|uniref:Uncharacterized protein n=1 Tax=Ficus carica TaxID=3494 RepID=A0AA87ZEA2_FICCA|nr:hypothetical protein TIFTF001_003070 [Ficus carica]